jgi:hypothetical protein
MTVWQPPAMLARPATDSLIAYPHVTLDRLTHLSTLALQVAERASMESMVILRSLSTSPTSPPRGQPVAEAIVTGTTPQVPSTPPPSQIMSDFVPSRVLTDIVLSPSATTDPPIVTPNLENYVRITDGSDDSDASDTIRSTQPLNNSTDGPPPMHTARRHHSAVHAAGPGLGGTARSLFTVTTFVCMLGLGRCAPPTPPPNDRWMWQTTDGWRSRAACRYLTDTGQHLLMRMHMQLHMGRWKLTQTTRATTT